MAIIHAPAAYPKTVLWVGGTGGSLAKLLPANLFGTEADLLNGAFKDDSIITIDYPSALWPITGLLDDTLGDSVSIGAERLQSAVKSSTEPLVVVGTSQGALVAQKVQAALNDDPSVPSSTTFVLIADPNTGLTSKLPGVYLAGLDIVTAAIPETRFNTIIVVNQYDLLGDEIKRPWNVVTQLNAVMALLYVHPTAHNADLSSVPAENITTTTNSQQGTTTIYHVPTTQLPLTMPLRQLGIADAIVDGIDNRLRPIVDEGYLEPPQTTRVSARSRAGLRTSTTNEQPTAAKTRHQGIAGPSHRQTLAKRAGQTARLSQPDQAVSGPSPRLLRER